MSTALLTDRYELTMVQAALHSGKADRQCVFEVFARQLPAGRRFGVVAGTGRLLDALKNFKFDAAEIEFLTTNQVVDAATLKWLANFEFKGSISGYQEGELYFAHSPILTVEASFAEAVVLETLFLSILNYDSAVASAAARMKHAAGSRSISEMGGRRAHEQAAVAAARAAYIIGFDATSNLEAGRSFGIPTMGTSAHSFTLLHDTEAEAFEAQLSSMGNQTTLLVDTFDIDAAVRKAVELSNKELRAVRIDSGDLGSSAVSVRKLLDELGAKDTKITVTSDLDEFTIAALAAAPVDAYGVGTSLVTGSGFPTAGFVYKLVAHKNNNVWVDVAKTSKSKTNLGGKKYAYRELENHLAKSEVVSSKKIFTGRPLQVPFVIQGEIQQRFSGVQGVLLARIHHSTVIAELPPTGLRLSKGEPVIPTVFI